MNASLAPGTRLGPYEIVAAVAAGGMGHVYRAVDRRLDRHVAIKVLPPDYAQDSQLRQRFDREARTVASLNHPHICVVFDIGEQNGLSYIVMEYLEGETLAARLSRGALPPDEIFQYGIEIADSLDRAHRHGIVHRDLKPANVMLTRQGTKLLDFGLARPPMEQVFSSETRPTGDTDLTAEGAMVGTLQYMAPEQLEGQVVDARTDIFAFGALLYEMATGERAFPGGSQASIIAAILNRTPPPPSSRQPLTPRALDHVVARCLAKDPEDRWQSARDIVLEMRSRVGEAEAVSSRAAGAPPLSRLIAPLAALAVIGAIGLASSWFWRTATPGESVHALLAPPEHMLYQLTGDFAGPPVVSPDGRSIVFAAVDQLGKRQLWVRRLDSLTPELLPGTEDATFPFWSHDSRSVAFFANAQLKRLDLDAGSALTLCPAPGGRGGAWGPRGMILFAPGVGGGLQQIPATGGTLTPVTTTDGTAFSSHRWPQILPDGQHFLYLAVRQENGRDTSAIFLGSMSGRQPQQIVQATSQAVFANGQLLYLRDRTLWAQPFDPDSATLSGAPTAITRDVLEDPTTWRSAFSATDSGVLVFQNGQAGTALTLYDRAGRDLGPIGERGIIFDVNISPDGRHIAVNRGDPADIWVYEMGRGTSLRLTFDPRNETLPVWSPDGQSLVYARIERDLKASVMQIPATGGEPTVLLPQGDVTATDWSRDGRYLLLRKGDLPGPGDIWMAALTRPPATKAVLETPFAEYHARFSPNERWVSYVSNESGRDEVYVMPFRPPAEGENPPTTVGTRVRVSPAGGVLPRWKGNGRELYYLAPDQRIMAATLAASEGTLVVEKVETLFPVNPKPVGWAFDVTPDGSRFVVNALGDEGRRPLVLITQWTAGLPTATR